MFKDFLIKKLIKKQFGDKVSDEQIDQVIALVKKNPELFQNIAKEIEAKVKAGTDQQTAVMEVMQAHQAEIAKLQNS